MQSIPVIPEGRSEPGLDFGEEVLDVGSLQDGGAQRGPAFESWGDPSDAGLHRDSIQRVGDDRLRANFLQP